MELPDIKPLKTLSSSEMNYFDLLNKVVDNGHDGFLRINQGPREGYILFKNGKEIAASYTEYVGQRSARDLVNKEYFKETAIKKIEKNIISGKKYVSEVFELNSAQIDFAIELNTKCLIKADKEEKIETNPTEDNSNSLSGAEKTGKINIQTKTTSSQKTIVKPEPTSIKPVNSGPIKPVNPKVVTSKTSSTSEPVNSEPANVKPVNSGPVNTQHVAPKAVTPSQTKKITPTTNYEKNQEISEPQKGSVLSEDDIEDLEVLIIDKIKNAVIKLPSVKSVEGSVLIDDGEKMGGVTYIILEYESKGFLNWIVGSKRETTDLEIEVIKMARNEIKNIFKTFHDTKFEDIELNFDIKVEMNRK